MAAAVLPTLWGISYAANRTFQHDLSSRAAAASAQLHEAGVDLTQVRDGDAELTAALPGLDALRALPGGYAARRAGGPPLRQRFGLYQSSLSQEAEQTYREALRRVVLPRLLLRLEGGAGAPPARNRRRCTSRSRSI